jgi:hypothetical protein
VVVASHWDDDHIRGLGEIVQRCKHARIALSSAYTTKDFLSIVRAFEPGSMRRRSGLRELWEIYDYLRREKRPPRYASADRLLWERKSSFPARVVALSPSDADVAAAIEDFRNAYSLAQESETRDHFSTIKPNDASVVLWVTVGDVTILLAGDLESKTDPSRGWQAVIETPIWQGTRAVVVKVPHHASADAYEVDMWNKMLVSDVIALVSPFIWGAHSLPTSADRAEVRGHTQYGFLTREPTSSDAELLPASRQVLGEAAKEYAVVEVAPGHIRARGNTASPAEWTIELFDGAVPL